VTQSPIPARGAFGGFDVRIDPWAVEYGAETPTEFQADGRGHIDSRRCG